MKRDVESSADAGNTRCIAAVCERLRALQQSGKDPLRYVFGLQGPARQAAFDALTPGQRRELLKWDHRRARLTQRRNSPCEHLAEMRRSGKNVLGYVMQLDPVHRALCQSSLQPSELQEMERIYRTRRERAAKEAASAAVERKRLQREEVERAGYFQAILSLASDRNVLKRAEITLGDMRAAGVPNATVTYVSAWRKNAVALSKAAAFLDVPKRRLDRWCHEGVVRASFLRRAAIPGANTTVDKRMWVPSDLKRLKARIPKLDERPKRI